jgi:hypothetical protein
VERQGPALRAGGTKKQGYSNKTHYTICIRSYKLQAHTQSDTAANYKRTQMILLQITSAHK